MGNRCGLEGIRVSSLLSFDSQGDLIQDISPASEGGQGELWVLFERLAQN